MRQILAVIALCLFSAPVWAAQKTITLSVPTMDCPVCPITVKKALSDVTGVTRVAVHFEKRQAIVVFDDARTGIEALMRATANAGYPSALQAN
jgi:periplasmic mercuric ion binding protein